MPNGASPGQLVGAVIAAVVSCALVWNGTWSAADVNLLQPANAGGASGCGAASGAIPASGGVCGAVPPPHAATSPDPSTSANRRIPGVV